MHNLRSRASAPVASSILQAIVNVIVFALCVFLVSGCVTAGRLDLSSRECADHLIGQLADILYSEGESMPNAQALAEEATAALASGEASPIGFYVDAPSGTRYGFAIHYSPGACLLRLFERNRPGNALMNNLTYIATRPLQSPCVCRDL